MQNTVSFPSPAEYIKFLDLQYSLLLSNTPIITTMTTDEKVHHMMGTRGTKKSMSHLQTFFFLSPTFKNREALTTDGTPPPAMHIHPSMHESTLTDDHCTGG